MGTLKVRQVSMGGPGERQFGLCDRAELHMRLEMGKHERSSYRLSFIIPFSLVSTSPSLFPPKYPSQQMSTFSRSPSLLQIIIPKSTVGSSQFIFLQYIPTIIMINSSVKTHTGPSARSSYPQGTECLQQDCLPAVAQLRTIPLHPRA